MKLSLQLRKFWFDAGWFSGEDFVLFSLQVGGVIPGSNVCLLYIKVAKLLLTFGFYLD